VTIYLKIIDVLIAYIQQAAESIAESVLSVARAEAVVAVTGEVASDLATIVESLTLNTDCPVNSTSNRASSSKPLFATVRGNKVNCEIVVIVIDIIVVAWKQYLSFFTFTKI